MDNLKIDYNQQMLDYYPEIFKQIREFQVMIRTESLQVEELHEKLELVLANSYVCDSDLERIAQWERFLGITPSQKQEGWSNDQWLESRRSAVIARLLPKTKLNSTSIGEIVSIFTGGSAKTTFHSENSTIDVRVTPPSEANRAYLFEDIERELRVRIPAHLNLHVERDYYTWNEVKTEHTTWSEVKNDNSTWEDVLLSI